MWIEFLINLPVAAAIAYFSWRVLRSPLRYWQVLLIHLIWFLPTQVAAGLAAIHPENIPLNLAVVIAQPVAIFLCFYWIGQRSFLKALAAFSLFFLILFMGSESGRLLSIALNSQVAHDGAAGTRMPTALAVTVQCILLFWGAEVFCTFSKRHPINLRWSAFVGVIAAQVVSIFVVSLMVILFAVEYRSLALFFITFLVLQYTAADLHLLRLFRETVESAELQQTLRLREQQETLQQEQYEIINEQITALRRMRHDYGNTLDTIRLLIAEGNAGKADALALSTGEQLKAGIQRYCGHPVLDALLFLKQRQAEKQGTRLSVSLVLPEALGIEDRDLLAIFANLLDNALEYCAGLERDAAQEITVYGAVQGRLLALRFGNTYLKKDPPALTGTHTDKADRVNHGHGISIVQTAARQYGGELTADVKDGMLWISMLLHLKEDIEVHI